MTRTPLTKSALTIAGSLALLFGRGLTLPAADRPAAKPVLEDNFEREEPTCWDFTDRAAWRISTSGPAGNRVLEQFQASKYEPPVRSPLNIALARGSDVGDFTLDVKVRSTGRDYGHRDLCLFFGHQDPSHFYYVHLGKEADPHAHSIFLVDGKPRVSIAKTRTKGTPWTDGWHRVRIVRDAAKGTIEVFFDDMDKPIMTAEDKTFLHGRIGLGSFDDTGMFDDVKLTGVVHQPGPAPAAH